ncbi:MAG: LysM peptidoglycan-binding domain-containing M23 family metallopeptidase [Anaerolineaceae bacterium]|nr:LysM peptidoglycan-binding domain-containing M23 family metallopeptidase [Anaerolineaceae bacterium]
MGHLLLALIIAMLISGRSYSIAMDPIIVDASANIPPLSQAAFASPLASPLPPTPPPATQPPPFPTETRPASPIQGLPTATSFFASSTILPPATATPRAIPKTLPTSGQSPATSQPIILYTAQSGDTLPAISARFAVKPEEISSPDPLPPAAFISPGQQLIIPRRLGETTSDRQVLPDSEFIDSPSAVDFDVADFVGKAGGFLSTYTEYLGSTGTTTGADIIKRISREYSINPRMLLALLELRAHWVTGQPSNLAETFYPLGRMDVRSKELYPQLVWAVDQLSVGFYSWREGRITDITFPDGTSRRLAPSLNAATVGLQYLIAQLENQAAWSGDLYSEQGLTAVYEKLFGSPWVRAHSVEPVFPPNLAQPTLNLPFYPGQVWSFSGGPHSPWSQEKNGGRSALDFAPSSTESGCVKSDMWVAASAGGLVTRSDHGVVILDLDGDGHEETGWVLLYLHIATDGRVPLGRFVEAGDPLGHPSCEGGNATGTHVHFVRKYNGEWIAADGPLSFNLSGWTAHAGVDPYQGTMTQGDQTVTACTCGSFETRIWRPAKEK